jgi:transposase
MAFILKIKKKKATYYYLTRNVRVNGVSKHETLLALGTTDDIMKQYQFQIPSAGAESSEVREIELDCAQYQFSAVAALYDISCRLGLIDIIDSHVSKRDQGLSVGTYMVLAAINRALEPVSKNTFYDWFKKTVLVGQFPKATNLNLSSQSFWNHMVELDQDIITAIEDDITRKVIESYNISTESLLFDNTNFFTFIDSNNAAEIPQRGHSKEKRTDLKIIGLSLMVSPEHNIPLFHETYPGNRCDSKQFLEIIDRLKDRCQKITNNATDITLVFDKGNNSDDIVTIIEDPSILSLHFVGSLRFNQCPEVLDLSLNDYSPLEGDNFVGSTVYRYEKFIYQKNLTVVATDNQNLREAQMRGFEDNIKKCETALEELKQMLLRRENGTVTKGKKPTFESVSKNITTILSGDYMKKVFSYGIDATEGPIKIWYKKSSAEIETVKNKYLGKTILFTNRAEWSNEKIVSSYRSQFHVEESFKQLKNTKFLSFRPVRHFTDNNIKVHSFYCIMAYNLTCLLKLEMQKLGHNITINKALADLMDGIQVVKVKTTADIETPKIKMMMTEVPESAKAYIDQYDLMKYAMQF